jgi:hypothetical protein
MSWGPDPAALNAELDELGIPATQETRHLLSLLATEPHTLYGALTRLTDAHVPAEGQIPQVDRMVGAHLQAAFSTCTEPSILHKAKSMGAQCKRLLAILIRDVGTPVPLAELLLSNGLRSATPRRLRELETEHGCFAIRTFSRDRVQHYVLEDPEPDIPACSRYWIRANLRNSPLSAERRALALLSAELRGPISRRDLDYVLPEQESPGHGRARGSTGESDTVIAALRARGYDIEGTPDGYVLESLSLGA